MESRGNTTSTVIGVIVALIVGGFVGWWIGDMNNNDTSKTNDMSMSPTSAVSSKAADLRASLVSMGSQHMDLVYTAVSSALQGDKSAAADSAALVKNGHDIGAAVGSVYGKDAEKTFDSVWDIHLTQFVNYAVASSKGDQAGKDKALSTIDSQYTHPLAAYLAKANPNLPEDVLYSSLHEHVLMTAKMIDEQAAGDYTSAQVERDMSVKHLEGLMSTLAGGIVKQYPDKF